MSDRNRAFARAILLLWALWSLVLIASLGASSAISLIACVAFGLPLCLASLFALRLVAAGFPGLWRLLNKPVSPRSLALFTPAGLLARGVSEMRKETRKPRE